MPIIFDSEFFEVKERQGDSIKAICKICGKIRTAYVSSTGNLTRHFKEKHIEMYDKLLEFVTKRYTVDTSQIKQTTFLVAPIISKESLRKLIVDFVINENLPYTTVKKNSFRKLLEGVSGRKVEIPSYETFISSLQTQSEILKRNLILLLSKQEYVCETIDAWSSRAQSYIGMTVHFIDEATLNRHSYVLAFRRIKFKQTYDNIAKFIHTVNKEFGLDSTKICYAVTDGGSAFVKAFREFGTNENLFENADECFDSETLSDDEDETVPDDNIDEIFDIGTDANADIPIIVDDVYADRLDLAPVSEDQSNISMNSDGVQYEDEEIVLPRQFRCTAHNLHLVAKVDFTKKLSKPTAKSLRLIFCKLFVLWRLVKRSSRAKAFCEDICGRILMIPNTTRWNSQYYACKIVVELKDKVRKFMRIRIGLQRITVNYSALQVTTQFN